jgi:iron complex outermembrane recepter protein
VNLSRLLRIGDWKQRLRLALDIDNVTNNRQRVRDGNGLTPYRYQPELIDPIGRRATLTLRKLF